MTSLRGGENSGNGSATTDCVSGSALPRHGERDRREQIVRDRNDRYSLIQTLGETCGKIGWLVHAWVLMNNHYHAVIERPQGNLVVGMRWFSEYAHSTIQYPAPVVGSSMGGRYKAVLVIGCRAAMSASSDRRIYPSQHDAITRVDRRTVSNEKCGQCEPAARTETEIGKSQREIGS